MLKKNIIKAYVYAQKHHEGQKRKFTDIDYFTHPKYVARIIEDITNDETMIVAALLHDVLEDTNATESEILELFGEKVLNLVKELTSTKDKEGKSKTEYLIEKIINLSEEALLIKLVDRYHNIKYVDKDCKTREHMDFVKKYWTETKEILKVIKRTGYTKEQAVLVTGIDFQLKFLEMKYKW